ncbi:hypothetical protein WN51_05844 [Melipona quadrifasciata]|uniref:Uncharacterized protein n=1 Tax=Melipona quadrifasciata TaxID=166423 RepID=A0A0M9A7C3_9HYME|nr:hypothetical protein WN51_05844 [Melipona quadrifasciata]
MQIQQYKANAGGNAENRDSSGATLVQQKLAIVADNYNVRRFVHFNMDGLVLIRTREYGRREVAVFLKICDIHLEAINHPPVAQFRGNGTASNETLFGGVTGGPISPLKCPVEWRSIVEPDCNVVVAPYKCPSQEKKPVAGGNCKKYCVSDILSISAVLTFTIRSILMRTFTSQDRKIYYII